MIDARAVVSPLRQLQVKSRALIPAGAGIAADGVIEVDVIAVVGIAVGGIVADVRRAPHVGSSHRVEATVWTAAMMSRMPRWVSRSSCRASRLESIARARMRRRPRLGTPH